MKGGRRWFLWAALAYAVIIAAVTFGLFNLYDGSRTILDEALGQRLLGVAGSLAEMSDGERIFYATIGDSSAIYYLETLAEQWERIRRQENLAEITLTGIAPADPLDEKVLFSTSASLEAGGRNDFWELDRAAVAQAALGEPSATQLYQLGGPGGTLQKSAHVPVFNYFEDSRDVVAIVTVSGNPDFFAALGALRGGAFLTAAAVLLILVLMGIFLFQINRSLERYRASIMRQENLAAMGRMTAGIAHEIRNPLGIIRGAGEHLKRVLESAGLQDEVVDFIPEEVDRLDQILTGYLAFGSDKEAVVETFDLGRSVRRSVGLLAADLEVADIRVDMANDLPPAPVRGDPRRFQQVLLNLLINAKDAMPEGGTLDISLMSVGASVVLAVSDTGTGLGQVPNGRLFEPFWTSKEKGSGLGLAMSRRIIEDMGGTIALEDRHSPRGARAEVVLPRESDQ
ncbi:MAG: ATP-binding protein [Candidatus Krumholzibacteriota bacterium]